MKNKINNAPGRAFMVSVFCLLLANLGLNGQDKYLNSYTNETEIQASRSVTLANGFYIPAGKSVRIFTGASFKRCTPFTGLPSTNQNYVSTRIFKVPNVNNSNINDARDICDVNQTVQYFDGLGRALQAVTTQGSPDFRDIVQPIAYDAFGREAIKYLPYPESTGNNGSYRNAAISAQQAFFNNPLSGVTAIPNTAFSETRFEASPLNRVLEQGAPGLSWQLSGGHTQKIEYRTNAAGDVKLWRVVPGGANGTETYAAGRLYKTTSKDENWKPADGKAGTIDEYKDLEGRVVLKRVWETDNKRLSTYYVYDDFGNLSYVLPPAVNENSEYTSNPIDNFRESDGIFKQFMYGYHYDGRRRMIHKKLPGKGWDYIVYNKLDQVVLSQDSVQRSTHQWLFNKYDAFGRLVSSGVYSKNSSLEGLQAIVNSQTQLWEIRLGTEYDGAAFPQQDVETQMVNYYDDYNVSGIPDNRSTSYSSKLKGLTTASKVRVLGTNDFLWTVSYYDDEARVVQIYKQHYLGGQINASNYDDITNKYSFIGELTESVRMHHAGSNVTKIANRYEYDHVGRKLASFEAINDGTEVALNKSDYNEVGQLIKKSLHSTDGMSFVQSNAYQYNERGWLSKINNPDQVNSADVFGMELLYGNQEDAFNGNIGGMRWQAKVPPGQGLNGGLQSFAYDYDKLNRLKKARYTTPGAMDQFNEELQYDIMGNISHLKRKNNASGYLNDFTYDYLSNGIGNQLWKVSDAGTAGQTSNYTYDANGNLKTDSFKGININYNMLNLPGTITKSGESLNYVYDASGQKLRKVYNGVARDYVSGIEYNNGVLEFIQTEEGRALPGAGYSYEYLLKDHLGNTRVAINQIGEVIQVQDYYAFGMEMGNSKSPSPKNQYKYNGKEMQEELGLNQLDYGARLYDPVIGRFNVIDRFSEKYADFSQYQYAANNPISNIDVNGDSTWTTTNQVRNGNNITIYNKTYITGKVLKPSMTNGGSAGDIASKLNRRLNAQSVRETSQNEFGGTTTTIYSIDANYKGANSMDEVSKSDHLVVVVDDVGGTADPNLGGGSAGGVAKLFGKVAYAEGGNGVVETAFHEVGHNLGLIHPKSNSRSDPMSYSGDGANFSVKQMNAIYRGAKLGYPNDGYNSAKIMNVSERYNARSSNTSPYLGTRTRGMRIPLPIKD